MRDTIRTYVNRRLSEGARILQVYAELKAHFKFNGASWHYVRSIEREYHRGPRIKRRVQ